MSDFFFGREFEIDTCWDALARGESLLVLGPRRIGKTELCRKLVAKATKDGWRAALVDISGAASEDAAIEDIESATHTFLQAAAAIARKVKLTDTGIGNVEVVQTPWTQRGLTRFQSLGNGEAPALLVLDEVPVFVQRLLRADNERGECWLHAFRAWRQLAPSLRIIVAGSIGLNTLAERHRLTTTINDLKPFRLDPFQPAQALELIDAMCRSRNIRIEPSARDHLLAVVGWHVPYYFEQLLDSAQQAIRSRHIAAAADINAGLERLLANNGSFLCHWRDRLDEHGKVEAGHMRAMLGKLAVSADGLPRSRLGSRKDRLIDHHLQLLADEGYIALEDASTPNYRFRSSLVRLWWQRRGAR